MKKYFKILIVILIAAGTGGFIYWQFKKKQIVKESLQSTVEKKTDSLYYIHYDSSAIDEINGNASFYNVTLQSDSVQKKLLASTDSLPNALYHIVIGEVTAKGVDIPGLLQKRNITASEILLIKPVVQIINTGADKPKPFTYDDTLQLYKKILGNFSSINASSIRIQEGTLLVTNKAGKPLTTIENINVNLRNFLIDSTRNYNNLLSYFVKDVIVSVSNIQLPESDNKTRINIGKLLYDAPHKKLQIGEIQQYKTGDTKAIADLKNIVFNQLNTDAFILQHQLKAGMVTCDGGTLTIYQKEKGAKQGTEKAMELSSDFIDAIQIDGLQTGNTTIIIKNPDKPSADPLIISQMKFTASNIKTVKDGSTLSSIINDADWEMSAGNFSLLTAMKNYRFSAQGVTLKSNGNLFMKEIALQPLLSEKEFTQKYQYQEDRYDFTFRELNVSGINYKKLIATAVLESESLQVQPILKIFNDRTLPPDPTATEKPFPHQALLKLPFQFFIKTVRIKNGAVYYKERGEKSGMTGTPYFTAINGTLNNVTNMPEKIKLNDHLSLNATALFLGKTKLQTEWILPLRVGDSTFTIKGNTGSVDGNLINQLTEPLAMLSLKSGSIRQLNFSFKGNNHTATGKAMLLYNDLKLEVLKMKADELKKKGIASFLANTLVKNDNPQNDKVREGVIYHERDVKCSFFNMIWKSILSGVKSTVLGTK